MAQVNTVVTNMTDGAVVTFASGSYTWGGAAGRINWGTSTKGVTFICETQGACDVSWSSLLLTWPLTSGNVTTTKLYRLSGFDFTDSGTGTVLEFDNNGDVLLTNIRIDHNTFNWTGASNNGLMWQISTEANDTFIVYGVFDHNVVNVTFCNGITFFWGTTYDSTMHSRGGSLGDAENFFVEDNEFICGDEGGNGFIDAFGMQGIVVRFNTSTDARYVVHGNDNNYGPSNVEWYGNDMTGTTNYTYCASNGCLYRVLHHQGSGTIATWGNRLTAPNHNSAGSVSVVQNYRSFGAGGCTDGTDPLDGNRSPYTTYRGYPCFHQPGRDYTADSSEATYRAAFSPVFAFKNFWSDNGAKEDMSIQGGGGQTPDYTSSTLVLNRDVYNAVSADAQTSSSSPFDGTVGIGHGTLANRPTTCTVGPDSDVGEPDEGRSGVMYWATDQGSWNTSTSNPYGVQQNGADGVLYMCTATNTWSVYYTPYTYPHPLQGGATSAPPMRLRLRADLLLLPFALGLFWLARRRHHA